MPAGAVLCVECGFDTREGQVIRRTTTTQAKKKRKSSLKFKVPAFPPAVWAGIAGVPVLIAVVAFLVMRGGSQTSTTGTAAAPRAAGARAPRPEPSRDPKDWRTSFPAFAANFTAGWNKTGRSWDVSGGPVEVAAEGGTIQWEGDLLGRDRRPIADAAGPEAGKQAFGFRFADKNPLPDGVVVLFAIDDNRAAELLKLSYRRVRVEGNLNPRSKVVWLDDKGFVSRVADAPPLKAGEPVSIEPAEQRDSKPLYAVWFDISRFEVVK